MLLDGGFQNIYRERDLFQGAGSRSLRQVQNAQGGQGVQAVLEAAGSNAAGQQRSLPDCAASVELRSLRCLLTDKRQGGTRFPGSDFPFLVHISIIVYSCGHIVQHFCLSSPTDHRTDAFQKAAHRPRTSTFPEPPVRNSDSSPPPDLLNQEMGPFKKLLVFFLFRLTLENHWAGIVFSFLFLRDQSPRHLVGA